MLQEIHDVLCTNLPQQQQKQLRCCMRKYTSRASCFNSLAILKYVPSLEKILHDPISMVVQRIEKTSKQCMHEGYSDPPEQPSSSAVRSACEGKSVVDSVITANRHKAPMIISCGSREGLVQEPT